MNRSSLVFAALSAVALSGCAQMLGGLRPDLNDNQGSSYDTAGTVGGRFPEHGYLDGDDSIGHSDRGPAANTNADPDQQAWSDPDRAGQDGRDSARDGEGVQTYSNTPNRAPPIRRQYKNGSRATAADFIDESSNEGSLWASDGQTNYYFTKNKVRGVGDIIAVNLEPDMIKDLGLEVKRTLTDQEKEKELDLAQQRAQKSDTVASSQAAPANGQPAPTASTAPAASGAAGESQPVSAADVDVSKSLEVKPGDQMMAEITERYPNGNYKIRGSKRIPYKNGSPRLINMNAVVRASDIGDDDVVASGKLYEYRLEAIR